MSCLHLTKSAGFALKIKMGEGNTTTAPDVTVVYDKAWQKTEKGVNSRSDGPYIIHKQTTTTSELLLLNPPQTDADAPLDVDCIIVCNRDTVVRTAFVYVDNGTTEFYLTAGQPSIPVGGTMTIDSDGNVQFSNTPITEIVAGNGLSLGGSGTSGAVTINVNVDGTSIETNTDTIRRSALTGDVAASAGSSATTAQVALISGKAAESTVADGDLFLIDDVSEGALNSMTRANVLGSLIAPMTSGINLGNVGNPVATGDLQRNSTGSRCLRIHDGTAVRDAVIKTSAASASGGLIYHDGTIWNDLAIGARRKFLGINTSDLPAWLYPTQTQSQDANYQLLQSDYGCLVVCPTTSTRTLTLPAPGTVGAGWWFMVKKTSSSTTNTVTIARNASETIDGRSASDVLTAQYACAAYITDGTNWHVLFASDSIVATTSALTNFTGSASFQNSTSVTLPPGDWLLSGSVNIIDNGATFSGVSAAALSAFSGTTTTDHVTAENAPQHTPVAAGQVMLTVPSWPKLQASSGTIYMKAFCTYSVGTPQHRASLRAIRVG